MFMDIGESGKHQLQLGLILCIMKVYTPFHILQYTFIGRHDTFYCSQGEETLTDQCFDNQVSKCENLTFTEETIVSEWSLVCDNNWLSKSTMSALMLGFLLGALLLGSLADKIGRKSNILFTLIGMIFFSLVSSISKHFFVYIMSRFLVGFFVAGNILSIIVLTSEIVGPFYRGIYGIIVLGSGAIGLLCLSLIASYLPSWRDLSTIVTLLGLPLIILQGYLVESPRWLFTQNRVIEAEEVLSQIAKGNGVILKEKIRLNNPTIEIKTNKDSIRNLLRLRKLQLITVITCYNWFINGAVYYGLTLAAGNIGGDIYTGTALSGAVEIPAIFLAYYVIEYYGRRDALTTFMISSGLSCLSLQLISEEPAVTVLALFGKMCISASFKTVYIHSNELFSTSIRNSAMGLVSAQARVGAILSPFIVMAGESLPGVQFLIFGFLGISGGILSTWLPETKDKALPMTVGEMMQENTKKMSTQHV